MQSLNPEPETFVREKYDTYASGIQVCLLFEVSSEDLAWH